MDNITMSTVPEQTTAADQFSTSTAAEPQAPAPAQVPLISVDVTDENIALNVMVSFLNVAQKRGAFDIAEAAKIWECVQKFIIPQAPAEPQA
jgi:hypothetical protein